MDRERKLFSVQQRARKRVQWSTLEYIHCGFIVFSTFVIFYIGLNIMSSNDYSSENAGIQGRKSFLLQEGTQTLDEDTQREYETLVGKRLNEIDFESLLDICGLPRGAKLSQCERKTHGDQTEAEHYQTAQKIHILGERHSGTNVATDIAHANFELTLVSKGFVHRKYPWVKNTEFGREFGLNSHKHNIQGNYGYYPGLSIVSIRNPYDWIRSMIRQCYFCDRSQLSAIRKGVREFLESPWTKGAHILPGEHYDNIFDLRKKKLCNHLRVAYERSDCVLLIRAEENVLSLQQQLFISKISNMTKWKQRNKSPKVFSTYLGRDSTQESFNPSKYFSQSLLFHPELDIDFVRAVRDHMDEEFEFALGYP